MRIRFGDFELDEESFLLERQGQRVPIRPKVFDLLNHLIRQRERVVRREELVEVLWGSTAVCVGSLSGLVNELRSALGERGRGPSSIRTVHARGYQFVAEVVRLDDPDAALPPGGGAREQAGDSPLSRLNDRLEASGAARLPRVLAEALLAHLAGESQPLEIVADWLIAEGGSAPGVEIEGDTGVEAREQGREIRAMRRVEPVGRARSRTA